MNERKAIKMLPRKMFPKSPLLTLHLTKDMIGPSHIMLISLLKMKLKRSRDVRTWAEFVSENCLQVRVGRGLNPALNGWLIHGVRFKTSSLQDARSEFLERHRVNTRGLNGVIKKDDLADSGLLIGLKAKNLAR